MDDPIYGPVYKQAMDLQYKFHDMSGGGDHPATNVIRNEIHKLVEEIETKKNPRDLEHRINIIQRQLKEAQNQNHPTFTYDHADYLHHNYEQMRSGLRKFHNY